VTLRVLPEAEEELSSAVERYERDRAGLGVELMIVVDKALEEIERSPLSCAAWFRGSAYRMKVLTRFPFVIFYRVEDERVEVVAFAHGKREPGYWRGR
jgi:hypothetical protein